MPRPEPTRDDATARAFLKAGAQLIDALLTPDVERRPARLRSFRYPPPLDWIRVEDVVRLAESTTEEAPSRKAFRNRWQSKDDYVRDLLVYTSLWQDLPDGPHAGSDETRDGLLDANRPLSERVRAVAVTAGEFLQEQPRALLLHHLVPVFSDRTDLLKDESFAMGMAEELRWAEALDGVQEQLGIRWRPGWDTERVVLAVQALLDGLLLRHRLQPNGFGETPWDVAPLFCDAVLALVTSAADIDGSGRTTDEFLDAVAERATRR